MTNNFFHFRPFLVPWQNYAGDLAAALLQTIGFTIAGFLGAIAIGLLVAVLRLAPWPGLRVAGTVEFAGLGAGPNLRRADALLKSVSHFLGPLNSKDAMRWMSFRPSMPDSLPVIGWAPGHSRAFFAFGHGHLGLSLAAVTGKVTAEAMAGRPFSVDITPFRPGRWLQNGSIAQAVN